MKDILGEVATLLKELWSVDSISKLKNFLSKLHIEDNKENFRIIITILIAIIVIIVTIEILDIVAEYRLFKSANRAGWECIIPIYYDYVKYKITWGNGWVFILAYIPIVRYIIMAITNIKVCKVYDRNAIHDIIGILLIPHIYIMVIAFNKDLKYIGVDKGKLLNKYI